jgi:segregation and condensation protein B
MSTISPEQLEQILEAALMVAGQPLSIPQMQKLFAENETPTTQELRAAIQALEQRYSERGIQLQEIASGFQFQARIDLSPWLSKLWEERPPRYSRAFLETLAIIAYRQPVTRAEIEDIRGVSISSSIFKTLLEREWIRLVGYKDVPGKPAIYGTTKTFLDHFNLKSLRELPALTETPNLAPLEGHLPVQLAFDESFSPEQENSESPLEAEAPAHEELTLVQNEQEPTETLEQNEEPDEELLTAT